MAQNTTSQPNDWAVELLGSQHERSEFDCGVDSLNGFLKQQAGQNAKKDFSKTFVVVLEAGSSHIVCYYTLAMGSLEFNQLPNEKHLPQYPIPMAHLGRLAVDLQYRGRHIGEYLLFHALLRIQAVSEEIGVFAVEVKALNDSAGRFYRKYGFVPLSDDPFHLYITLKSIRKLGLL